MRRLFLASAAALALAGLARAGLSADDLPSLEAAWAGLRAIPETREGLPLVIRAEDARVVSFLATARAHAKEGSPRSVNILVDALDDRVPNIYADHLAHFAVRRALAEVPAEAKGAPELVRRLRQDKDWTKQVSLAWAARYRPADPELDQALRTLARGASKQALQVMAIKALGERRTVAAVDELIDLLDKHDQEKGRLWYDVRLALHAITGYDREDAKAWRSLWREKGRGFDAASSRGGDAAFVPRFGVHVPGDRVVVAVDTSASLHIRDPESGATSGSAPSSCPECGSDHGPGSAEAPPERSRIARAKLACQKILKALKPKARFNVVRFDSKITSWQPKGGLIAATPHNVASAEDYLAPMKPVGSTRLAPALEAAFATEEFDLLYVITDGAPTLDVPNSEDAVAVDEVIARARVLNRFRGTRIFPVGYKVVRSALLELIAKEHGGAVHYLE